MKISVQMHTIKIVLSVTSGLSKVFPIVFAKVFTAPSLENGCLMRLEIASPGRNCSMKSTDLEVFSAPLKTQNKYPLHIPSPINQTIIVPTAKADLFTKIPKNNPIEKNPTSFIKKAMRYSKSDTIIENSL